MRLKFNDRWVIGCIFLIMYWVIGLVSKEFNWLLLSICISSVFFSVWSVFENKSVKCDFNEIKNGICAICYHEEKLNIDNICKICYKKEVKKK